MRQPGWLTISSWLIVVALPAGLGGCGEAPRSGNIALHVTLPEPAQLTAVRYRISGAALRPSSGAITAAEPTSSFSRVISHIPAGEGYLLQVDGQSADGKLTCEAMTTADVQNGRTTPVNLQLACKNAGDGQVSIVIGVECPTFQITSFSVSPLMASIGSTMEVAATTSSVDAGSVAFQWTSSTGTFANPAAEATTYTCEAAGDIVLTALATWGPCDDSKTVTVSCLSRDAGSAGAD